jgi:hypothetical protein
VRAAWVEALASPRFRILALAVTPALFTVLVLFRSFLEFVEARSGALLSDPVLRLVRPHDVALPLFVLIYLTIVGAIFALIPYPRQLIIAVWGYIFVLIARMAIMYLMPLDPPRTMVPLHDPFVDLFGPGGILTRDLFFSGHTATLFLIALALPKARQRAVALAATFVVAAGVLVQHVHYAADVLAAPFFSYACYRLAWRLVNGSPDAATAEAGSPGP